MSDRRVELHCFPCRVPWAQLSHIAAQIRLRRLVLTHFENIVVYSGGMIFFSKPSLKSRLVRPEKRKGISAAQNNDSYQRRMK